MTNEKILELAIKKAINNGFLNVKNKDKVEIDVFLEEKDDCKEIWIIHDWDTHNIEGEEVECEPLCCGIKHYFSVDELLFNHEFAKCFWCEDIRYIKGDMAAIIDYRNWEEHLQKLATEIDRIGYLKQFLD